MSLLDAVTDIYMIMVYREQEDTKVYGYLMLSMVLLNICLQLYCVMLQNWKAPLAVKLKEIGYVVTFLKPAIDAKRVASGNTQPNYAAFSPGERGRGAKRRCAMKNPSFRHRF